MPSVRKQTTARKPAAGMGEWPVLTALRFRREGLSVRGVVRHLQAPSRAAQSGTQCVLRPHLGRSRRLKARRRNRLGKARPVRNCFATRRPRVRQTSPTPLVADRHPQTSARKQTAKENQWEESEAGFRPCVQFLDKSSDAQFLDRSLKGRLHFPYACNNSAKREMQYSR